MNIISNRFYILHTLKIEFEVKSPLETLPVIWNRDGEYRIIPREVVENAVDLYDMNRQQNIKILLPAAIFTWSQGISISNLAGRALVGD